MFLKPLKAQTMWKTLEMIIAKRMQNMVHFENKNIIFVDKIHFEKNKKWRIGKLKNPKNTKNPKIRFTIQHWDRNSIFSVFELFANAVVL